MSKTFLFGTVCLWAALFVAEGFGQTPAPKASPPDFGGFWQHAAILVFEPVPGKPGPVQDIKGFLDPGINTVALEGDYNSSILQPWAADIVKRRGESARAGKPPTSPQEVCEHSGVPNVFTLPAPLQIVQTRERVTLLFQRDHQVRRVYLNEPHSPNPPRTWYGESVGHYEGDTLVIDTIGMNANTPVDFFGTPHSEALHVIERFRLINNGRQMEIVFTVADANTFTTEWTGRIVYNRSDVAQLIEEVCAENNLVPNGLEFYDIPQETRARF
jgi:hypothetical protein